MTDLKSNFEQMLCSEFWNV